MFDSEFFPTPSSLVHQMLSKLSQAARYFLEPSAGKGDIAEGIKERFRNARVDCIEQSPELIAVLADKDFPIVGHDWLTYAGVCYYDAIVMNPPFSNGDEHLLRAWISFTAAKSSACLTRKRSRTLTPSAASVSPGSSSNTAKPNSWVTASARPSARQASASRWFI
ncbi:MAG: hypothetical protein QM756_05150 [Polyangiaceae bacterium]